jgi:hypothetical protein
LDETSPEEIAMKQHEKIHECLNFKIKLSLMVSCIEFIFHILFDREGSPFKIAVYPFLCMLTFLFLKVIMKRNRWLEDNSVFLLQGTQIFFMAECSVALSPNEYKVFSP